MSIEFIALLFSICGFSFGGFAVWATRTIAKITIILRRLTDLEEKSRTTAAQVDHFKDDFQNYFLAREKEERVNWKQMEKRIESIEKALMVFIAKNGGTVPPLD